MSTSQDTALQAKYLWPNLTAGDLQRSIRFYEGLGFVIEERWEDNGALLGVMLRAGDAHLGLSQDDWKKGRERVKGVGMRLYVGAAQDIDALAARATEAGIELADPPHDTPWGSRAFNVVDPDGFQLTIARDPERS